MVYSLPAAPTIHLQVPSSVKWDQDRLIRSKHRRKSTTLQVAIIKGGEIAPGQGRIHKSGEIKIDSHYVSDITKVARQLQQIEWVMEFKSVRVRCTRPRRLPVSSSR